ncbi:hypothetical protein ACFWAR_00295 [Streptomyces sp. NPDC059917]|uniref:hypothetical protein n=1 Tax=Streptomyces sp. NPDC059917 TaxID=3347002 RepID=UPI00364CA019
MRSVIAVPAAAAVVALAVACSPQGPAAGSSAAPPTARATTVVEGTLTLQGKAAAYASQSGRTDSKVCTGARGYDDVREGAQITVYDRSGTVLGAARLGSGLDYGRVTLLGNSTQKACEFHIGPVSVPAGAGPYQVELGGGRRGKYTLVEGAPLALTLGTGSGTG